MRRFLRMNFVRYYFTTMHTILFVCDKDLIEYVAGLG